MTVVLLLHPKINWMNIPPVKIFMTIPLCGNFSNHISHTFLNHSFHWFKLKVGGQTFFNFIYTMANSVILSYN